MTIGKARQYRARELCVAAVRLFHSGRDVERHSLGCEIRADGLEILYSTPFQAIPSRTISRPLPDSAKYLGALLKQQNPKDEPYALDIWAPKKVLSVVWHDGREPVVVSYTPGEWETCLETLAAKQHE